MNKVLYYVWKDGDRIGYDGFEDITDALMLAEEINADEVEELTWNDIESYQNYEISDTYRTVWKK